MESLGLEFMVAALCLGDFECGQASKAYYYQRPQLRVMAKNVKSKVERVIGEQVAYAAPALMMASLGHSYQIRISKNLSVGGKPGEFGFKLSLTF